MRMEGRVRRLRGSPVGEVASAQTAQTHERVGIPMEVPLPRKVRVASICLMHSQNNSEVEAMLQRGLSREHAKERHWRFDSPAAKLTDDAGTVSYTHLRAHETRHDLVC